MKQRLLTFCILILAVALASWQPQPSATTQRGQFLGDTTIVRNAPVPLPKGDTASKYIKLLPGFQANPANGQFYVATIDTVNRNIDTSDNFCYVIVKALDGNNQERTVLNRGTADALTLQIEKLDVGSLNGVTYNWTGPNGNMSNTSSISVSSVGQYAVTISKNGQSCVPVAIRISSTPCIQRTVGYVCNTPPTFTPITDDPNNRLTSLAEGDVVQAGDFDIKIVRVYGGGQGGWYAVGSVNAPYLQAEVEVLLNNATINTCYQFTGGGTIETSYDPAWTNILDLDGLKGGLINTLLDLKDFLSVYQNDVDNNNQVIGFKQQLERAKADLDNNNNLTEATKVQIKANLNEIEAKRQSLQDNPSSCETGNSTTGRIAAPTVVCPIVEITTLVNTTIGLINAIPRALCKETGRAFSIPAMTKGDGQDEFAKYQKGIVAHLIVEWDYFASHPLDQVFLEYSIPGTSSKGNGNTGFADIANKSTGEIFELKHAASLNQGDIEVQRYVDSARVYCPNIPNWERGKKYPIYRPNRKCFPWPLDNRKIICSDIPLERASKGGVIEWYELNKSPALKTVPVFLPVGVAEKLRQIVRDCITTPQLIEQKIIAFLQQNPDVVYYVQALAIATAVTICIATLVEDVLTGFVGVADDVVCFEVAYNLVKIARALGTVAKPVSGALRPVLIP